MPAYCQNIFYRFLFPVWVWFNNANLGGSCTFNLASSWYRPCWGKLKQVKLSGTALKPIKIQCWRTIGKPIIWEHDPLALMKKIWSATIADSRFMQFIAKIFDYSIIIHMQLYSIYLALHEQWAKSKEPGVMSRLMECHFYVVNNDIFPIYEPQFPCSFCTFSLFSL